MTLRRSIPLDRRIPLRRGAPLQRRTPLRKVNPVRRNLRYERAYGERGHRVRAMPCVIASADCRGRMHAAHAVSRGAGGTRRDLVPLCSAHHREQHDHGIETFCSKHQVDLRKIAGSIAALLDAEGVP